MIKEARANNTTIEEHWVESDQTDNDLGANDERGSQCAWANQIGRSNKPTPSMIVMHLTLTNDQLLLMMDKRKGKPSTPHHSTNYISSTKPDDIDKPSFCLLSHVRLPKVWAIDSSAIDHMCEPYMSLADIRTLLRPIWAHMLNSHAIHISTMGTYVVNKYLTLHNLL